MAVYTHITIKGTSQKLSDMHLFQISSKVVLKEEGSHQNQKNKKETTVDAASMLAALQV